MKNLQVLEGIEKAAGLKKNRSFLSYNSLIEEAIRLSLFVKDYQDTLIVIKENNYMAQRLREQLQSFFDDDELLSYLPEESMRAEEIASSFENRAERINVLYQIIKKKPKLLITSPYGFIRHLPKKDLLVDSLIQIRKDDVLDKDELVFKLKKLGYDKVQHVEVPMTFAARGYIVDVYSVNYDLPLRIEFFDDVVDSIRFFDINSQATKEVVDEVEICFARDVFFSDEEKNFLKENIDISSGEMELNLEYLQNDIFLQSQYFYRAYFPNYYLKDYFDNYLVYLSDEEKINDHLMMLSEETVAYIREMYEEKKLPLKFYVYGDYNRLLGSCDLMKGRPYFDAFTVIEEVDLPYGSLDYLLTVLRQNKEKYQLIIVNETHFKEIKEAAEKLSLKLNYYKKELLEGITLVKGELAYGFSLPSLSFSVYSENELFHQRPRNGRFANRYGESVSLNSYEELNQGDYVVHDQYGIGQYVNIETRKVNGIAMDYLRIIYKGNDELLVPLSQFSLVRKYVSRDGVVPKLHKLGSKEWIQTKQRVEENVNELAERLITLYAARDEDIGFAFSKDNELQKEFEDDFIFDLTSDQVKAINEVKEDMEKKKPMDRLLCGDVGFGKTEVAIRASFKAINDNKQVAYLCPTTVLSLQHYNTYKERFSRFPGKIALLNRFISEDKQREILKELKEGKIDVLIGTHRILSNDVIFKDLGLLIIDEEQRFGVEHKEKIRELKNTVDVLSLSATPIPRTLQMSLIGIRSLSTLDTPPRNRYPVQTYIVHKSENLIKEVIMRELERNGQVFYLYNNTEQIYGVAQKIRRDIPYARVEVAHGQMNRNDLESVMMRFYQNEINVLVCTTIVETGLDIPNANTIIIDNAQNFGLSQLYQIKGRVGRSERIAYAYLLIPERKQLKETSLKRLEAIKEFASLGSGYKIAMRDLTIRGAGDLLGPKQSGFIDNVGLDLYLSMLNRAIKMKKGEEVEESGPKLNINIPLQSYIPDSFNDNDYEKLKLYHELDLIDNKYDLLQYFMKIQDEYGRLPLEVASLFEKKKLELLYNLNCLERISNKNGRFSVVLSKEYSDNIDGVALFEYCNNLSRDIKISYKQSKLELFIDNKQDGINKLLKLIDNLDGLKKK